MFNISAKSGIRKSQKTLFVPEWEIQACWAAYHNWFVLCFPLIVVRLAYIYNIYWNDITYLNLPDFIESLEARLVNGKDYCSGRVEVRNGEAWKTVCDTDWTLKKAEVVCELLECGRAVEIPSSTVFGQGSGSVVEATNSCFDNVTSLQQCSLKGFKAATCGHEHDASVLCAGKAF